MFNACLAWSFRITSTYVENTVGPRLKVPVVKDHLHIRGEHLADLLQQAADQGSPPHTWRTQSMTQAELAELRITSTYVENTLDIV